MSKKHIVVGIGSSAGGLEALKVLLSKLKSIKNCSYIIAQHLSPTHKSMMVDLLSRTTNIPVLEIKSGISIRENTIYMAPENKDIFIENKKIYLKDIQNTIGPKPSVNYFFSSLSKDFKECAIGIILSGTGSDGSFGVRAIKAEGGITIAQSPNSAKYDGMPKSAIDTGKVDIVLPIEKIAQEIENISECISSNLNISHNERLLQQIFRMLFEKFNVDFSLYKRNTISRRIDRRLATLKIESVEDYLDYINQNKQELNNLYHDILIGVTNFFRDKEAYESLGKSLEKIVSKKSSDEEIRIWSIGCSTGEEPYSIAILLAEILGESFRNRRIKIFATDIDEDSLSIARTGSYWETSLENIDKSLVKKYFTIQKNRYEIKKDIREKVIFSKHNIMADSPFIRIDLISCRNLLIYFNQALQSKFFPICHYSLNDNGLLFLGQSESLGSSIDLFSMYDKNAKIFKALYVGIKETPRLYNYSLNYERTVETLPVTKKTEEETLEDTITQAVKRLLHNQSLLINSSNDVVYIKGNIPYLKFSEGKITSNIFKLVSEDIALDLRLSINEARKTNETKITPYRTIVLLDDVIKYLRIAVVPIEDKLSEETFCVLFFQCEDSKGIKNDVYSKDNENELISKLTDELNNTKVHLQSVIEELENSSEETQSLNEELQSSNEELQSSNEELETTNEELQSTNEELQTAYSELRLLYEDREKRTKQLEELTKRLSLKGEEYRKQKELTEAIIDTVPISIIMLNEHGEIVFANKETEKLFMMSKKEIISKTYDSRNFVLRTFSGMFIENKDMPFYKIRTSYEPIVEFKHTLEVEDDKLYLSLNAAPLFDVKGLFQGAIMSLDDLTVSEHMKSDLKDLENDNNSKIENSEFTIDILELILMDYTSNFKNTLNKIALKTKILEDKVENSEDLKEIQALIKESTLYSNEKIDFYVEAINRKKVELHTQVDYILNTFESLFDELDIKVSRNEKIDSSIKVFFTNSKEVLLKIIEFLIKLRNFTNEQSLEVSFLLEEKTILVVEIKNRLEKDVSSELKFLSKELQNLNKKLFFEDEKSLLMKVDFDEKR